MYYEMRRGLSKKSRDLLVLVIILLIVCVIVIGVLYARAADRDRQVHNMLIGQGDDELDVAFNSVVQLSRGGGSYTTMQMAQLRQHLYAVSRLNAVASALYGDKGGTAGEQIDKALDYVSTCESRLMKGQAIDESLAELRGILETLSQSEK